jgi:hypothetical protein
MYEMIMLDATREKCGASCPGEACNGKCKHYKHNSNVAHHCGVCDNEWYDPM